MYLVKIIFSLGQRLSSGLGCPSIIREQTELEERRVRKLITLEYRRVRLIERVEIIGGGVNGYAQLRSQQDSTTTFICKGCLVHDRVSRESLTNGRVARRCPGM